MTFTQAQLRDALTAHGLNGWAFQLADTDYQTVPADYLADVWSAWIDSLQLNAPQLLTKRDIGGGKTRTVPRWIEQAGDCDDHALLCYAHALTGNWIGAIATGNRIARTCGVIFIYSEPRAENRNREGAHALLWFIDDAGKFGTFEPGDGDFGTLTPTEAASVQFGLCA